MSLVNRRVLPALAALIVVPALSLAIAAPSQAVTGGDITGEVIDSGGSPLAGISVQAYDFVAPSTATAIGSPVETNAMGQFDLTGIPAGRHKLKFADLTNLAYGTEWSQNKLSIEDAEDVIVADGQSVDAGAQALPEAGEIRGTVTDVGNAPVGNIRVQPQVFTNGSWAAVDPVMSSTTDGGYRLAGLAPGTYKIAFADDQGRGYVEQFGDDQPDFGHASQIQVASGTIASNHNAVMSKLSSIYGRITGSDAPYLANISLQLVNVGVSPAVVVDDGFSDGVGFYEFHEIPAGTYQVRAFPPSAYLSRTSSNVVIGAVAHNVADENVVLFTSGTKETANKVPAIVGTVKVGHVLHETAAAWSVQPTGITRQWKVNGAAVAGATGTAYTIRPADLGKAITVTETATVSGLGTATSTSKASAKVGRGTISCTVLGVLISGKDGKLNVGDKLRVVATCPGAKAAVQWYLAGKKVPGAKGRAATYALTAGTKGKKVAVRVTITRTAYTTLVKNAALGKVLKKS